MKQLFLRISFFNLVFLCACSSWLFAQKWDTLAPIPESFTFPVVAVVEGKIHIMGGGGIGGATNHHFAYDPSNDTWESRAPVPYRAQQPAGAEAGGKIHFFGGGYPNSGTPLKNHYVYDPVTDSWEQAADLTSARAIHYGVTLDSVLYSLAGQGVANLCQTYDPNADAWSTKNNLPDNSFWYGAHVSTEGHIYRFCGGGYTAPNKLAHRYDPDTDSWASLPMFPVATHGIAGAALGTKIFLAGGYHDFLDSDEVWIFDTETEQYTPGVPLPLGRTYHNMVAIDDCIYVLGGNHPIDTTVRLQLLRLCPFESTSVSYEFSKPEFKVCYYSGEISCQIPEELQDHIEISILTIGGQEIFKQEIINGKGNHHVIHIDDLPPSIYIARLDSEQQVYSCKFFVNQ